MSIFLSYNHVDGVEAHALRRDLSAAGIDVRMDASHMNPGDDIAEFVRESIKRTEATVCLISERSLLSGWVAVETMTALRDKALWEQRRFIGCYLDDSFLDEEFRLRATETIDERLARLDEQLRKRQAVRIDSDDIDDDKSRLHRLRKDLGDILKHLKTTLCLDVSEPSRKTSVQRLCDSLSGTQQSATVSTLSRESTEQDRVDYADDVKQLLEGALAAHGALLRALSKQLPKASGDPAGVREALLGLTFEPFCQVCDRAHVELVKDTSAASQRAARALYEVILAILPALKQGEANRVAKEGATSQLVRLDCTRTMASILAAAADGRAVHFVPFGKDGLRDPKDLHPPSIEVGNASGAPGLERRFELVRAHLLMEAVLSSDERAKAKRERTEVETINKWLEHHMTQRTPEFDPDRHQAGRYRFIFTYYADDKADNDLALRLKKDFPQIRTIGLSGKYPDREPFAMAYVGSIIHRQHHRDAEVAARQK